MTSRKLAIDDSLMSRYWEILLLERENFPETLVKAFTERLPHLDPLSWPKRFEWGGIFVNGEEWVKDGPLPFPCRIEYYEPRFNFEDPHSFFPKFKNEYVVYEDEDILAVFKPTGLPSLPAREQKRYCLRVYLQQYCLDKYGHDEVHMPSRLDMSTAGLVLTSKNPRSHNKLQRAYETRRVEKFYLLEARAADFEERVIDSPLGKDPTHPVLRMPVETGGKPAITNFRVLARNEGSTFIQAKPLTGRTHQIRVHAAYGGFPILGDKFYGGEPDTELHLLSYGAKFPHPQTGVMTSIALPAHLLPSWAAAMSSKISKDLL